MRRITLSVAVCVAAVLTFRIWATHARLSATKSGTTPVTIVYLIKNFDESGAPARSDILVRAFRSDGSRSQYRVDTGGRAPIRSVTNYEQRVQASIDALTKTMIRHPVGAGPRIPATCESAWGGGNCQGPVPDVIAGFSLERVVQREAEFVHEFLVAPTLDYKPLRRIARSAEGSLVQEWTAIDVQSGEPDAALFQIPSGYDVVTRDVYYQRGMEARSKSPDPDLVERFRLLEEGRVPVPGCGKK